MPRQFDIPAFYHSELISAIKKIRHTTDHYKQDLSPALLSLGHLQFKIARHFGFCFGVENAIEIAYRALQENPKQRVFLLSEMIHNARVNTDLQNRGIRFIQKTDGTRLIPLTELRAEDIVIVPAFGATIGLLKEIESKGIQTRTYNTTCPFVERVWNRSLELGRQGYTIIIHGRDKHEETRATFSRTCLSAPTLIIRDMAEANILADFIRKERPSEEFYSYFAERYSRGFCPERDLARIGIVNQTTMLAAETREIAAFLNSVMEKTYPEKEGHKHFADTRDTLCYATTENQEATRSLLAHGGDLAIVIGGYNSSNTSHLVELLETEVPVYYIQDAEEILSVSQIRHLDLKTRTIKTTDDWLPSGKAGALKILLTAGASCPDSLVGEVIACIARLYGVEKKLKAALNELSAACNTRPV